MSFNGTILLVRRSALMIILSATLLFAQSTWYDHYSRALDAIQNSQWTEAILHLEKALEKKNAPDLDAESYALVEVEYLPHYWLGVAQYNLGRWDQAEKSFRDSESWKEVTKSNKNNNLKIYRRIMSQIVAARDSLLTVREQAAALTSRLEHQADLSGQLQRFWTAWQAGDHTAAEEEILAIEALNPDESMLPLLRNLAAEMEASDADRSAGEATAAADRAFKEGLTFFVAGNYRDALLSFRRSRNLNLQSEEARDWIAHTELQLQRIGEQPTPDSQVVTDTVRLTDAPVIALNPTPASVRTDSISLSGLVGDEQTVARVEFTLNGESFSDHNGQPVVFAPGEGDDPRRFPFRVTMPLKMGDNQIVVLATDGDANAHRTTFPLSIERKLPLYRSPAVLSALGLVLLLMLGSWVISRQIRRRIAFVNRYNPYIAGAPVRNDKMFFGRDALLHKITNTLHNNSLMIHGPRRIGKTSLLHQLKRRLESDKKGSHTYIPVYIDLQGTPEARFFGSMMEDILESLDSLNPRSLDLQITGADINSYSARDFSKDIRRILQHLREGSKKPIKMVLLIDEVDELNSYGEKTNQRLRSIFMKTFAEDLVAVMSGSYIRRHWESEGSPWYNFFEVIEVMAIDREEAKALIQQPVSGIFSYDDAAIEKILEDSQLVPYRIQKFCVSVINRIIEARRQKVVLDDVIAVREKVLSEVEA